MKMKNLSKKSLCVSIRRKKGKNWDRNSRKDKQFFALALFCSCTHSYRKKFWRSTSSSIKKSMRKASITPIFWTESRQFPWKQYISGAISNSASVSYSISVYQYFFGEMKFFEIFIFEWKKVNRMFDWIYQKNSDSLHLKR